MADEKTDWVQELITSFTGAATADLLWKAIHKLVGTFVVNTGERMAPHAAEWIGYKLFGRKVVDEQLYNDALVIVQPNDRRVLHERLFTLGSEQNDYYRMTIMRPTAQAIADIMTVHSKMSPTEWVHFVSIMNLEQAQTEEFVEKFKRWMGSAGNVLKNVIHEVREASSNLTDAIMQSPMQQSLDLTIQALTAGIFANLRKKHP